MPGSSDSGIYDYRDRSLIPRIVFSALIAACLILAYWILFGSSLAVIGTWFGKNWHHGDFVRCVILFIALTVYFQRLQFTIFVFSKRGIRWSEVLIVVCWILFIFVLLSIETGRNSTPFSIAASFGVALFLIGSWMNTWAEYQRNVWKQRPENRGCLYTLGLFRYTRHPNYCGDLLSFSGMCIISGCWITVIIPVIMFSGFVFANIPALDKHLQEHYGDEFIHYASHTYKLIPFIY